MPFIPKLRDERHTASVVPPSFAAQNRALVFPITGDDPSAHFLAAAPGRTPQRLTDRLAAGDRSSLGQAFSAELPVQSILTLHLYHIPPELARENCKKTQKGRTRRVRPRLSKGSLASAFGKEDSYERNPSGVSFVFNHRIFRTFYESSENAFPACQKGFLTSWGGPAGSAP